MSSLTKLTLRLDAQLIARAKTYASLQDRSLSQLVADYFAHLAPAAAQGGSHKPVVIGRQAGPITAGLRGALAPAAQAKRAKARLPDRDDYRAHPEKKYL